MCHKPCQGESISFNVSIREVAPILPYTHRFAPSTRSLRLKVAEITAMLNDMASMPSTVEVNLKT